MAAPRTHNQKFGHADIERDREREHARPTTEREGGRDRVRELNRERAPIDSVSYLYKSTCVMERVANLMMAASIQLLVLIDVQPCCSSFLVGTPEKAGAGSHFHGGSWPNLNPPSPLDAARRSSPR